MGFYQLLCIHVAKAVNHYSTDDLILRKYKLHRTGWVGSDHTPTRYDWCSGDLPL